MIRVLAYHGTAMTFWQRRFECGLEARGCLAATVYARLRQKLGELESSSRGAWFDLRRRAVVVRRFRVLGGRLVRHVVGWFRLRLVARMPELALVVEDMMA